MKLLTLQNGLSIRNTYALCLCKLYISTQFVELNTYSLYVEDDNCVSISVDREAKDAGRQQSE
jgi:hypothetical protein